MTTMSESAAEPGRSATMRDVAALAGVSIKTVSRVVNREAGVSGDLADRVADAVILLGYRPNMTASSLRRADGKSSTIGLLLDDVANPYSSTLCRAIEDVARRHGSLVFTGSSDEDPQRERELLRGLASRGVDGLIVVPAGREPGELLAENRRGTPVVVVDRLPGTSDLDAVTVDNRDGARRAVGHLAAHGHSRIAFLGDRRLIGTAAQRYEGYVEGLALSGLTLDRVLVRQGVHSAAAAEVAAAELLAAQPAPTAFFTGQNLITIGTIRALQNRGLQRRVGVVGFDDFMLADLLDPGVTVIAQDPTTIGRTAAEMLFARLAGERDPARQVVIPTELIARGSGEILAG